MTQTRSWDIFLDWNDPLKVHREQMWTIYRTYIYHTTTRKMCAWVKRVHVGCLSHVLNERFISKHRFDLQRPCFSCTTVTNAYKHKSLQSPKSLLVWDQRSEITPDNTEVRSNSQTDLRSVQRSTRTSTAPSNGYPQRRLYKIPPCIIKLSLLYRFY